jgi:hypothetical protein
VADEDEQRLEVRTIRIKHVTEGVGPAETECLAARVTGEPDTQMLYWLGDAFVGWDEETETLTIVDLDDDEHTAVAGDYVCLEADGMFHVITPIDFSENYYSL